MSISEKSQAQGGKPSGLLGRLVGRFMNIGHRAVYRWALEHITIDVNAIILDVGCGGGQAVKHLAAHTPQGKVYGLDHSPEMVRLATRVNAAQVKSGRVEIRQGTVSALPYPDGSFDIVSAFETIQFWPALAGDLQEVRRVLKPAGLLLVANRYPEPGSSWSEFLQLKSAEAYEDALNRAGFTDTTTNISSRPGWILITARHHSPCSANSPGEHHADIMT